MHMLIVSWFSRLSRLLQRWAAPSRNPAAGSAQGDVATGLLRDAQALAGLDPHEAQRLRSAACAYLRVIR